VTCHGHVTGSQSRITSPLLLPFDVARKDGYSLKRETRVTVTHAITSNDTALSVTAPCVRVHMCGCSARAYWDTKCSLHFYNFENIKISYFYVFKNYGVKYVDRYTQKKCRQKSLIKKYVVFWKI
jgi:hypothetical protein